MSAFLLAVGRRDLDLEELTPEGLEDVDCRLGGGEQLFVQAKDRAGGAGRFGWFDLRSCLTHAAGALRLAPDARFAVVTDAELVGGLCATGFDRSLADALPPGSLRRVGDRADPDDAAGLVALLARTHIVRLGWLDIGDEVRSRLRETYQLPPAVAALAYTALIEELSASASDQRHRSHEKALRLRPSELDALVHRLRLVADVGGLDLAEQEGLVEPLDFTRSTELSSERFLLGVDVGPGHIAAGLDVIRADELEQIFDGLREDQYVVIEGPSGAGKSALLWRAAHELGGRFRVLRLRRIGDRDVPELVRYVECLAPSTRSPLLVCADDVGRPAMAAWEQTVDRLIELPGVHLVGAVRAEDFRASVLRGRARVVRPKLTRGLAEEVVAQLERRGTRLLLEPDDAFSRADGLLMEFLAQLLAGRRLRDVVTTQVEERLAEGRSTEREILRYVCTAHAYGVTVPASSLGRFSPHPDDIPGALHCLEDEFLVCRVEGGRWAGLHELRSRVVADRLHELPPPTEAQTIATLLGLVDPEDCRGLILGAALAGHDLAPIASAAAAVLGSGRTRAAAAFGVLDGLVEAEEVVHARACLELVRKRAPALDAVAILPLLQLARDGWVEPMTGLPNGEILDALAAALPSRPPSLAAEAAMRLQSTQLKAAVGDAPIEDAVPLLELLAFLGKSLPAETVRELTMRARDSGEIELGARAIAALAQATPESCSALDSVGGTVKERLDAVAEARRDILSWTLRGPPNRRVVKLEAIEYGEGSLNDRLVGICRLVCEACPEIDHASITALAGDGTPSIQPDAVKAPVRRYLQNPIRQLRRNVAFDEALHRLVAADSWTERLRRQESLVAKIGSALGDAVPRLLNPHDNDSRIRSWLGEVEQVRSGLSYLPSVPLPPSASVDRNDAAKNVLTRLETALSQLATAVSTGDFGNLLGIGSQFQGAFSGAEAASPNVAGVTTTVEEWPIVQRLLSQLEDLRGASDLLAGLLLALAHRPEPLHRTPRRKTEKWAEAGRRVVDETRDMLLREERAVLATALGGIPCEIMVIDKRGPGEVRLVQDQWLVLPDYEHWLDVSERLTALPADAHLALGFRTYLVPTAEGIALPLMTRLLGSYESQPFLYPVEYSEALKFLDGVGVTSLRSTRIDEALKTFDLIVQASERAGAYRLRDPRFSREPELREALAAIDSAKAGIDRVEDADVQSLLVLALTRVVAELETTEPVSLAADLQRSTLEQTDSEALEIASAVAAAAVEAAVREQVGESA